VPLHGHLGVPQPRQLSLHPPAIEKPAVRVHPSAAFLFATVSSGGSGSIGSADSRTQLPPSKADCSAAAPLNAAKPLAFCTWPCGRAV